jgi:hypothetical protein
MSRYFSAAVALCRYGELDNTRLVSEYGFALCENPFHCLIFSEDELLSAAAIMLGSEVARDRMGLCRAVLSQIGQAIDSGTDEDQDTEEHAAAAACDDERDERDEAVDHASADAESADQQACSRGSGGGDSDDESGVELQLFGRGFAGLALACAMFLLGSQPEAVSGLDNAADAVAALTALLPDDGKGAPDSPDANP